MGQLERKHGRENMRVLLVLSAVLLAVLAHPDYSDSWEEFKEKYTKQYESDDEETYRAGVWNNNVVLIKAHNLQADQDEITYYLGGRCLWRNPWRRLMYLTCQPMWIGGTS